MPFFISLKMYKPFALSILFIAAACQPRAQVESPSSEPAALQQEWLPSWNPGESKEQLMRFVQETTTEGAQQFIPEDDRIACFDNDGTLWAEQPLYFQLFFAFDRIRTMAPEHPEWKEESPFKEVLEGNYSQALAGGEHAIIQMVLATHAGMSTQAFDEMVRNWADTARHPVTQKRFVEMVYQPMLELLEYLRANGYKTFIVSGGGIDFMRPWASGVYGIPKHQIIGSMGELRYVEGEDQAFVQKEAGIHFIDDKAGKPIQIQRAIGQQPIIAVGNSDGDFDMLRFATSQNPYPSLGVYIHHTDAEREYAYDRNSSIGRLDKGLDRAGELGWLMVDMQKDWSVIWPE